MQLVTWNTQWCCGVDRVVSPERIVQTAQAMGAFDVLCLQEIAVNYPKLQGGPEHQLQQLQDLLPGWSFCFGPSVHEWTAAGEQQFGNLIATQLPVLQVQHYPLPYPADENIRSMPRMCTVVTVQDPKLGPVRVMTTHLEYHSQCQRLAQARYLRRMHFEALSHTYSQPQFAQDGSPYQTKAHTSHAVLCGDFNFGVGQAEYEALMAKAQPMECLEAGWPERVVGARWHDAWTVLHAQQPHAPTFGVYDNTYAPEPMACDFVWLSDSLRSQIRSMQVDTQTQASDHQPIRVVIGG